VFQLPPFTVVVWVRKTAEFTAIRGQLLAIAAAEPDESTEYEGMVDFHWGFNRVAGADQLAAAMQEISERPEVVVLRIISRDDRHPTKTLKDERNVGHQIRLP
jgi:hypothetical protein